jgi:4-deoxy-L-threo-5-hexosulose-uronate ketol-isomerase
METRFVPDQARYSRLTTAELRAGYMIENLFQSGAIQWAYTDVDRAVVGGAVPTKKKLALAATKEIASAYFAERREIGVINIGGKGSITVDGKQYALDKKDCLYIGRGSRKIEFASADAKAPAWFYFVSYPAHAAYPTTLATPKDAVSVSLGARKDANERTINKYILPAGIKSCQLVMGFTQLKEGSIWNTMSPHTHARRTEVYMYFDVEPDAAVFHIMGPAEESRHLVARNGQVVLSPPWSMHAGAGTRAYAFVWAMGGENQDFDDMDQIAIGEMK